MQTLERKTEIISEYRTHGTDTGSPEVQVALLTDRITRLTQHLRENKHDFSTRRGLLKLVGQRRRQLRYLSKVDVARYHTLIQSLGLRR
jgi:small subunit ribosomal protein S15